MSFLNWHHYRARAIRAEARVRELERELQAERELSRQREGELLDRVLNAVGQFGLKTTAIVEQPRVEPPKQEPQLNGYDQAKLAQYQSMAVDAGQPPQAGVRAFWAEKNGEALPFEVESVFE